MRMINIERPAYAEELMFQVIKENTYKTIKGETNGNERTKRPNFVAA